MPVALLVYTRHESATLFTRGHTTGSSTREDERKHFIFFLWFWLGATTGVLWGPYVAPG